MVHVRAVKCINLSRVADVPESKKCILKNFTLIEKPNMQKHIFARPSKKVALATNLQIYLLARSSQLLSSYSDRLSLNEAKHPRH